MAEHKFPDCMTKDYWKKNDKEHLVEIIEQTGVFDIFEKIEASYNIVIKDECSGSKYITIDEHVENAKFFRHTLYSANKNLEDLRKSLSTKLTLLERYYQHNAQIKFFCKEVNKIYTAPAKEVNKITETFHNKVAEVECLLNFLSYVVTVAFDFYTSLGRFKKTHITLDSSATPQSHVNTFSLIELICTDARLHIDNVKHIYKQNLHCFFLLRNELISTRSENYWIEPFEYINETNIMNLRNTLAEKWDTYLYLKKEWLKASKHSAAKHKSYEEFASDTIYDFTEKARFNASILIEFHNIVSSVATKCEEIKNLCKMQ